MKQFTPSPLPTLGYRVNGEWYVCLSSYTKIGNDRTPFEVVEGFIKSAFVLALSKRNAVREQVDPLCSAATQSRLDRVWSEAQEALEERKVH